MNASVENRSTRCATHPTQIANWYCNGCQRFLCDQCTVVSPLGRLCISCKLPCRELSSDRIDKVISGTQQSSEEVKLARALESRNRERIEKERAEREARLQARITARKAENGGVDPLTSSGERVLTPIPEEVSYDPPPRDLTPPPPPDADRPDSKELEMKMKEQIAKSKSSREMRLRPQAITRRVALPPAMRGAGGSDPKGAAEPHPPLPQPAKTVRIVPDTQRFPRVPQPEEPPPIAVTMYNPAASSPATTVLTHTDPLFQLGERVHLKGIGTASSVLLLAGFLMIIYHSILSYQIVQQEQDLTRVTTELRTKKIENINERMKATEELHEKELMERELRDLSESEGVPTAAQQTVRTLKICTSHLSRLGFC